LVLAVCCGAAPLVPVSSLAVSVPTLPAAVARRALSTDNEDTGTRGAAPTTTATTKNHIREPVERIEKYILEYIHSCTQHVKKMAQSRIQLAKAQMEEFKALEDFEQIATPAQWNIHLILKPKMKLWSTKNKNYQLLSKRVELDMPPKIIEKVDFSFKIDESIISQDEAQAMYNQMRQITKDFRTQAMTLYVQSAAREYEILSDEIKSIVERFPQENDDGFDAEPGYAAFKQYHELRQKRMKLEIEQSFYFLSEQRTAARRRTTELATLKRKMENCFVRKKVSPGRPLQQFIAELDILLQTLHNAPIIDKNINKDRLFGNEMNQNQSVINSISSQASQSQTMYTVKVKKKKNYGRLVKRLKHKFKLANVILQKSDKSKVFHLGKVEDYRKKSADYMEKTQAYKCLGSEDPLPDLIQRTNKYLIKPNEVELAYLYYLPKVHKPGTPLRPIISGLKHPTIKISKFLDDLLRPLFDRMAQEATVSSGFELVKKLDIWSKLNMDGNTIFCTIDVVDLYTMIPQVEGVLSLKKMLDYLKLKKVGGLKIETITRLSRFFMQNNYFSYDGQFYHQIRGGAMGSPLTLTMANCYMFLFERRIATQIKNSGGLYFRYIDDLFIVINWPARHFLKQIDRWNKFDENIKLNANVGSFMNFLDLYMENCDGILFTTVYQKPSYEPYYLPFNSIHPLHMKKNIPFTMLLRVIQYCSTFQIYLDEREKLRIALLLNKYPNKLIEEQFNNVLLRYNIDQPLTNFNYDKYRQKVIDSPIKEKVMIDYEAVMFIHFTYSSTMKTFPVKFHQLWNKYFEESPINEVRPILGTRNVKNIQRRLAFN
ncbi:unnamed protein product, partial [Rotaria sp. Silwood2]